MDILDIHTHHPVPQPQGVESICMHADTEGLVFMPSQRYSIGIHPWDTTAEITPEEWARLESLAAMPEVVAIGECGIDLTPHGGPLFRQILDSGCDFVACDCETCKWQIEMSTHVPVLNPISVLAEAIDVEATVASNK